MRRRQCHNQLLDMKGQIRVFCRIRPLVPQERGEDATVSCKDMFIETTLLPKSPKRRIDQAWYASLVEFKGLRSSHRRPQIRNTVNSLKCERHEHRKRRAWKIPDNIPIIVKPSTNFPDSDEAFPKASRGQPAIQIYVSIGMCTTGRPQHADQPEGSADLRQSVFGRSGVS